MSIFLSIYIQDIDYTAIDADETLDSLKQIERDEEDRFFDSD